MEFFDFYRKDRWPTIFCPGCGIGIVMNAMWEVFKELDISLKNTVFVSGIGCSGRVVGYIKADSLHTTHGRPLAFATGIKLANPDLNVVVFSGDGDIFGIGGNHVIHAARRNIDIKTIVINNHTYGLTGGQLAPTTPRGMKTTTSPYGNAEYPFGMAELVSVAGANYVARWTVAEPYRLIRSLKEAFAMKGFSFIEVVSPCPTNFGRRNKFGDPVENLKWIKSHSERLKYVPDKAVNIAIETTDKLNIGVIAKRKRPVWGEIPDNE